ncbi:MAG: DUF3343 domain-containing protein [Deltaproteobacteria bacterium]|jgi:hypothetical protein|nr:DUF3343 domain-containing protein [Deltaproteobacteria bacterium]
MSEVESYYVALFDSTSAALLAEKLLKEKGIPFKIIPVPRHISSDCGVCIRFFSVEKEKVKNTLKDKVDVQEILPL